MTCHIIDERLQIGILECHWEMAIHDLDSDSFVSLYYTAMHFEFSNCPRLHCDCSQGKTGCMLQLRCILDKGRPCHYINAGLCFLLKPCYSRIAMVLDSLSDSF